MLIGKYDFKSIVEKLKNIAQYNEYWKDYYESSFGQIFIELISAGSEEIGYYLERRAQELYQQSAIIPSSRYQLGSFLGYSPVRNIAGRSILNFQIRFPEGITPYDIIIPKGTLFKYIEKYYLTAVDDIILKYTDLPNSVPEITYDANTQIYTTTFEVRQGVYRKYERPFGSIKTKLPYVIIPTEQDDIDFDTKFNFHHVCYEFFKMYILKLDDTVEQCYETDAGFIHKANTPDINKVWFITDYYYEKLMLSFDMFGVVKNPKDVIDGKSLIIEYLLTNGSEANIKVDDLPVTLETDIYKYNSGTGTVLSKVEQGELYYTITTNEVEGCIDGEDSKKVSRYSPHIYASGNRAVTKEEYRIWAERFPLTARASSWAEEDINPPNFNWRNRVGISVVAFDKLSGYNKIRKFSNTEVQSLINFIKDKNMSHTIPVYIDPIICWLRIEILIWIEKSFSASSLVARLEDTYYTDYDTDFFYFGQVVFRNDFEKALMKVSGIKSGKVSRWFYNTGDVKNEDDWKLYQNIILNTKAMYSDPLKNQLVIPFLYDINVQIEVD